MKQKADMESNRAVGSNFVFGGGLKFSDTTRANHGERYISKRYIGKRYIRNILFLSSLLIHHSKANALL